MKTPLNLNLVNGIFLGLSSIITYFLFTVLYNLYIHPLSRYPGPKLWAATRLTWIRALQSGSIHRQLKDLHDVYGLIVRIAPDELSYITAQAWKDIYGTRPGHKVIERNRTWFKRQQGDPWSIMGGDEAAHAKYKRAFMGAFTENAVKEQAPVVELYVGMMVAKLKRAVEDGRGSAVVDMVEWLNFTTFDISGELSFADSFGSVEKAEAHPWVQISCRFGKGVALVASVNFLPLMHRFLRFMVPKRLKVHRQMTIERLQKRLAMENGAQRQDFIGSVQRYNNEKAEKVTEKELGVNMSILVFAGSETTSSALASTLFGLMRNQEVMQKTAHEIRSAFKSEDEISVASTGKLEYLTAVISEGIRVGPPSVIGVTRVVPKGGETICGRWVPGDTYVAVNQYPAFRSSSNFNEADEFRPQRFLDEKTEDNLDIFQPFGLGRHKCLGEKLAWAEMRLVLARLLYTFDISSAGGTLRDWSEQKTFIFWEKEPLRIRLKI